MKFEFLRNSQIQNHPEETPDKIHDKFLEPFDEQDVLLQYNKGKEKRGDSAVVYKKNITDKFKYNIWLTKFNNGEVERIVFYLSDKSNKNTATICIEDLSKPQKEAYWNKHRDKDQDLNGVWNLHHRQNDLKSQGVSGSDFLQQAESYLRILKKNNLININTLMMETSQISVIEWSKKNGFDLDSFNKGIPEDFYSRQNGENHLRDGYSTIRVEENIKHRFRTKTIIKDDYIIKSEVTSDPRYKNEWKEFFAENGTIKLGKEIRYAGRIIHELVEAGYIPRFTLEKKL